MDSTNPEGQIEGTFNSSIPDATIPDPSGMASEAPSLSSGTPLSGDVDPIHEFEEPEDFIKSAPLMGGDAESASSEADMGLDTNFDLPNSTPGDEEAFSLESADLDEDLDGPLVPEIPMGNLDVESADEDPEQQSTLMSPSLDAPEVPGEVDIEALGDNAIEDLLPPDARLDPIEE